MGNFFEQFGVGTPSGEVTPPVPLPTEKPKVYSADDLTQDVFYMPIERYMQQRFGVADTADWDRETLVRKYLNNLRGFSGGNSYRAVEEISWLNSLEEDQMSTAGEAYSIYENMQSIFGETTVKEKLGAVGSHMRSFILDPVNLVSFGAGKAVTWGGSKAGAKLAQRVAQRAYERKLKQGFTQDVAVKAGVEIFDKVLQRSARQEALKLSARRTFLQSQTGKVAVREVATTTAIDSFAAMGTDYAYQMGLIRTGNQEEYSYAQTGLAALAGLVMGGLQLGSQAARSPGRLALAATDIAAPSAANVNNRMDNVVVKSFGSWAEKVEAGKKLEDIPSDVFVKVLLGDDNEGLEGLGQILLSEGFVWAKRSKHDKISNWIADIIKESDPQDMVATMDTLRRDFGFDIPENYTAKEFADVFAAKINEQARGLNSVSQLARKLRKDVSEVTFGDFAEDILFPPREIGWVETGEGIVAVWSKEAGKTAEEIQSNTIRLIVSNPATTALNVKGWGFASTMNSAVDVGLAIVHGGEGVARRLVGDSTGSKEALRLAAINLEMQKIKMQNLLDPHMTYDAFRSYALARPEALRSLTEVLPGGVDDLTKHLSEIGFDPSSSLLDKGMGGMEKYTEFAGLISGVQAQDVFTKSQEFVYQLDKKLRQEFDMGWSEFLTHPNAAQEMATARFAKVEAEAVYETQRAIFSRSYKGRGGIGEIATVIEDARKIPLVGLMVPFGRFFNNTLATTVDASGLSLVGKLMGKHAERSTGDLFMRTAIGWGLVASMVPNEREARDAGLNWNESIGADGQVIDRKFDFPASMYKAGGRLFTYYIDAGQEIIAENPDMGVLEVSAAVLKDYNRHVPAELAQQIRRDVFGQITRELDAAGESIFKLVDGLMSGEAGDLEVSALAYLLQQSTAKLVSGATRPFDPINQIIGLTRGADFSTVDRRQGAEWINNSFKYMDQFRAVVLGEDLPDREYAHLRSEVPDVSKFMGVRERTEYSAIEKLANFIGKPSYKLGSHTFAPEADNVYNRFYYLMVESAAQELVTSEKFINGDLELRTYLANQVFQTARANVLNAMERDIGHTGNDYLAALLELSKKSKKEVRIALRELKIEESLADLSETQIEVILSFIAHRKDYLERQ